MIDFYNSIDSIIDIIIGLTIPILISTITIYIMSKILEEKK